MNILQAFSVIIFFIISSIATAALVSFTQDIYGLPSSPDITISGFMGIFPKNWILSSRAANIFDYAQYRNIELPGK